MTERGRPRRQGKAVLAALGAAGLLAGSGGVALASPPVGHLGHGPGHGAEPGQPGRDGHPGRGGHPGPKGPPVHAKGPADTQATVLYVAAHGSDGGSGSTAANDCQDRSAPCATIAHAVSVAAPGATIVVGAGDYIVGSTSTSTPPSTPAAPVSGAVELSQPVTLEAAGRVALTGTAPIFSISGAASSSASTGGVGAGVTIQGFRFEHVTGSGDDGAITAPSAGAGNVTITGNTFTDLAVPAITYLGGAGLTAPLGANWQILGNRIDGVSGAKGDGIDLQNLADSVVAGNVVTDVAGSGIVVAGSDGVLVEGNTVRGAGTSCTGHGPQGCTVSASSTAAAIQLANPGQTNVTVVHNLAADSPVGVAVGQAPGATTGSSTTGTLTGAALGSGIAVIENALSNDTTAGVASSASTSGAALNAMLNWWGCPAGPASAASGTGATPPAPAPAAKACAAIIGNVDVTPFATWPIALPPGRGLPPGLAKRLGGKLPL